MIEVGIKFTEEDIQDKELLRKMVETEAIKIYASSVSRKNRSLDDIRFAVKQSKIAELFLIENFNFRESDIKYHDLMNENDEYIEVKAYNVRDSNAPFVIKDIHRYKTEKWSKSSWYYLFRCYYGEYKLLEKIKL